MILQSITLDNIRSYAYQEIRFPRGSVLLSGDIGAGKSTILHAIEFALFGVQRGDLSGSSLLRHGKNEGFVQLHFTLHGKEIIIRRTLKRAKSGIQQDAGHLVINGAMVEATPIELKTHILSMLGYPKDILKAKSYIYRYTVYTPQEQMKQILFDDRESRLDTLRKVFGIDRYKRISENVAILTRNIREQLRGLEGQLTGADEKRKLLEQYQRDRERLAHEDKQVSAELVQTSHLGEQRKLELHQCEQDLKAFTELKQQLRVAETTLAEREQLHARYEKENIQFAPQLGELQQRLAGLHLEQYSFSKEQLEATIKERERKVTLVLQKQAELKEKLTALEHQISGLERELQHKQQQLQAFASKQEEYGKRLAIKKDKAHAQQLLHHHDHELKQLLLYVQEHDVHVKNAASTIEKITKLDQCPLCLQPVSPDHKYEITAEENRKIEEHNLLLRDAQQKREQKEAERVVVQKQLDEAQENETRLATLQAELSALSRLREEIEEKQRQFQRFHALQEEARQQREKYVGFDVSKQQSILEQERQALNNLREGEHLRQLLREREERQAHLQALLTELDKAREHLQKDIVILKTHLASKTHLEQYHAHLRKELDTALQEERRLEVRHASLTKELEGIVHFSQGLAEELRRKEEAKNQAARLSQLEHWLQEHFLNLLRVMERHILLRVYQEFNELFQKWFSMLMEDETMLVRLDAEFTPIIEQNGYETDMDALSGGEKTAIALAYRLALNKVINDIISSIQTKDLLILDEPTDGFSQQQLDRLKDVLDQLGIPQILLVSHESKIESFVDHVLRVEKTHHISRVGS